MTGVQIIKVRDQLRSQRSTIDWHYQELARTYTPREWTANQPYCIQPFERLYTSKPQQCAQTMANGLASLVIPRKEIWFEFLPPQGQPYSEDDDVKAWYREASEETRGFFGDSNYYEEMGEALLELVIYGTSSLFVGDLDDRGVLFFKNQPCGSYYIADDQYGRVDCFYRDLWLTAEQAAQEFGVDKLSEEIRNKLSQADAKTEKFCFVHAVGRNREKPESDAPENEKKAWFSVTVEEKTKKIVQKTSYDLFPFPTGRYRKDGNFPYGFGPGTVAIGDANQVAFLNQMGDVGAERNVYPPIIAPSSAEGEIQQGPGGINYVDENVPNQAAIYRELEGKPDLQALEWRMNHKERDLENAFQIPFFSIFAQAAQEGHEMTATQANYIAAEKIQQFSPIYGRLMSEMIKPQLSVVFNALLRAGAFPEIPMALRDPSNPKRIRVPAPEVRMKNQIELALAALSNRSFIDFLSTAGPLIQLVPTTLDYFDFDQVIPDLARNSGTPERWMRKLRDVHKLQQARAEAEAQQARLMAAEQAGAAAANFSKATPDVREAAGQALTRYEVSE